MQGGTFAGLGGHTMLANVPFYRKQIIPFKTRKNDTWVVATPDLSRQLVNYQIQKTCVNKLARCGYTNVACPRLAKYKPACKKCQKHKNWFWMLPIFPKLIWGACFVSIERPELRSLQRSCTTPQGISRRYVQTQVLRSHSLSRKRSQIQYMIRLPEDVERCRKCNNTPRPVTWPHVIKPEWGTFLINPEPG